MSEPDWMPTYEIQLWEGGFKNRLLETVEARAGREVDAVDEATALLEDAWKPGARKGRRARPLVAIVSRVASGRSEQAAQLLWTITGVVRVP